MQSLAIFYHEVLDFFSDKVPSSLQVVSSYLPDQHQEVIRELYGKINVHYVIIASPVVIGFLYMRRRYSYWSRQGVPGPKPFPIIGTLYLYGGGAMYEVEDDVMRKYGPLVGCYDATTPVLMIGDADVVKEVSITKLSSFNGNHKFLGHPILKKMQLQARGDEWKRMRSYTTPIFTSSRIKQMLPIIHDSVESMVTELDKKIAEVTKNKNEKKAYLNLRSFVGLFSVDVIAKAAFATDVRAFEKGESHEFMANVARVVEPSLLKFLVSMFMPHKVMDALEFSVFPEDRLNYTVSFIDAVVQEKKRNMKQSLNNNGKKGSEMFLDGLINAKDSEGNPLFTHEEILANSTMMFGAGYETTRTTLCVCCYLLSFHPEIQETLYQEVLDLKTRGKLDQENVMNLPYLEAVINETLRYYPAATHVDRVALEETTLSNGVTIPKGGIVRIPIYHIHHREEYFPQHRDFNPERFLPENKDSFNKNAFIPFFTGPRNCLGMRFAYLESKWTIANIILKYRFSRPVDDKDDFRKVPANAIVICPDVYVVVEKR